MGVAVVILGLWCCVSWWVCHVMWFVAHWWLLQQWVSGEWVWVLWCCGVEGSGMSVVSAVVVMQEALQLLCHSVVAVVEVVQL